MRTWRASRTPYTLDVRPPIRTQREERERERERDVSPRTWSRGSDKKKKGEPLVERTRLRSSSGEASLLAWQAAARRAALQPRLRLGGPSRGFVVARATARNDARGACGGQGRLWGAERASVRRVERAVLRHLAQHRAVNSAVSRHCMPVCALRPSPARRVVPSSSCRVHAERARTAPLGLSVRIRGLSKTAHGGSRGGA